MNAAVFLSVVSNILGFNCAKVSKLCDDVHNDVSFASILAKKYPSNVFLLRYEDFVHNPYGTLDILLNFLELPPDPSMDAHLEVNTRMTR